MSDDAFRAAMLDLFGDPATEIDMAAVFTPRVLRRAQRAAQQPAVIARANARRREDLVTDLVEALRGCDEPRARALIEDARALFDDDALAAAVQEQARVTAQYAPLNGHRDANGAGDPELEPYGYEEEDWCDDEPR